MNTLKSAKLVALIGVGDRERARNFYSNMLGLTLTSEDDFALQYESGGTVLRLTAVPKVAPPPYSSLGWSVDDIGSTAAALAANGVAFERYSFFEQDGNGVWTAPDGAKVAWFKDPDGNLLSIVQFAPMLS
jgi:catechol 2,3-dioxygenase-like lactoylglutathione lyase family enzyme